MRPHPVADGQDGVEVVVIDQPPHLPPALGLNRQVLLDSCLRAQLLFLVDVLEMQADILLGGPEQFRHRRLREPDRPILDPHRKPSLSVVGGVEQELAAGHRKIVTHRRMFPFGSRSTRPMVPGNFSRPNGSWKLFPPPWNLSAVRSLRVPDPARLRRDHCPERPPAGREAPPIRAGRSETEDRANRRRGVRPDPLPAIRDVNERCPFPFFRSMIERKGGSTMTRIILQSRTGPDGTLHLDVPLGPEQAGREVQVVIEPAPKRMTQAEYAAWVQSMAGSITDPAFERPPQLPLEEREPLS